MKPLPDELEILKVFEAIKAVSSFKIPDLCDVILEPVDKGRRGYCSDVGQVGFNLFNCKDRNIRNFKFVETVVHEIVHYNCFELGHNVRFYVILNDLLESVLKYLRKEKDNVNAGKEEAK